MVKSNKLVWSSDILRHKRSAIQGPQGSPGLECACTAKAKKQIYRAKSEGSSRILDMNELREKLQRSSKSVKQGTHLQPMHASEFQVQDGANRRFNPRCCRYFISHTNCKYVASRTIFTCHSLPLETTSCRAGVNLLQLNACNHCLVEQYCYHDIHESYSQPGSRPP